MKSTKLFVLGLALCLSAFGSGTRGGSPPAPIPVPPVPAPDYAFECQVTLRSGQSAEYMSVSDKFVLDAKNPSFNTFKAKWSHSKRTATIEVFERFEKVATVPTQLDDHQFYVRLDHTAAKWTDLILQTQWTLKQDDGKLQRLFLNQGGDHTQVKNFAVKANLTSLGNQQLVSVDCTRTK